MSEQILVGDQRGRVLVLTLNRPRVRNALSGALIKELRAALALADSDPSVDVIVLTGADPAFCAGIDLSELAAPADEWDGDWNGVDDAPHGYPWVPTAKPVIGAVNGAAITGGLEVALMCDLLIASDQARFADTHGRVSVVPGWGLPARLASAVGFGLARRMSLTGEFLSASDARAAGLVTEVVPHDHLLPRAVEVATAVSAAWTTGGRELHELYRESESMRLAPLLEIEKKHFDRWMSGGLMASDERSVTQ